MKGRWKEINERKGREDRREEKKEQMKRKVRSGKGLAWKGREAGGMGKMDEKEDEKRERKKGRERRKEGGIGR